VAVLTSLIHGSGPRDRGRFLCLALVLLAALPATAEPPETERLALVMTSGISGRLEDGDGVSLAGLAATVREVADRARERDRTVIVLDAGRTVAPSIESRLDGGRAVLAALEAAGCRIFAPAALDLSLGPEALAVQSRVFGLQLLTPVVLEAGDGDPDPDLALLEPVPGVPVALLNVVDQRFAARVDLGEAAAVDPSSRIALLGERAPDNGLRVVLVHDDVGAGLEASGRLSWDTVRGENPPDLVIDPFLGQEILVRRRDRERYVHLVGRQAPSPGDPWRVAEIRLDLRREPWGWTIVRTDVVEHEVRPAVEPMPLLEARIQAARRLVRQVYAGALDPSSPATLEELQDAALEGVRQVALAEVAMLPRGAFQQVTPALLADPEGRREAVERILAVDQGLVRGRLRGSELEAIATEAARRSLEEGGGGADVLLFKGLGYRVSGSSPESAKAAGVTVNGRPVEEHGVYSVVTTATAAAVGYGPLSRMTAEAVVRSDGLPVNLRRDVVLPRLLDPERTAVNLIERPVWRWGATTLGLQMDGVRTNQNEAYQGSGDSRARADDSSSVRADAEFYLDRLMPVWRWENRLEARFGLITTGDDPARATDDEIRLETSAVWTRQKVLFGGNPFASAEVLSEFRRNENAAGERQARRSEQAVSAGLDWSFTRVPRLRLGLVARHVDHREPSTRVGLQGEFRFVMPPRKARPGYEIRIQAEDLRDDDQRILTMDLNAELKVPITGSLLFRPALNLYVYDESALDGAAQYGRLTLGLSYAFGGRRQVW
jgi:hypothetical protein